ncbi:MAG TPA: phosphotransferase [Nocardioidaceae bacterium]|nr:phosphotransferase [Nocardioidaceae bacterium]
MDASLLDGALERAPLADNDGKSGATLDRVVLADGRRVIVKRFDPADDLVMRMTGDTRGREVEMFQRGIFDLLPDDVGHSVVGGWFEEGYAVLVMRDLGDAPLRWSDRLDEARCTRLLRGITSLHRTFHERPPEGLTPVSRIIGLFEPDRIRPYAGEELVDFALRGWELWAELVPGELGERILALAQDTTPLTRALEALPPTFVHGDLATVNVAFEGDRLVLIDWGMASVAPGAVDIGRFLAGCAHMLDVTCDDFLAIYRREAAEVYDERATRLALLSGLVWLGWNKALDIAEHPDQGVRDRERVALEWWLARADEGLGELTPYA